MRKNRKYFDSTAIGSSLLSTFIEESPDHALIEVKPTNSMENGRVWEDLVEHYIVTARGGESDFTDKYFISTVSDFPNPKKVPAIPELLDSKDVKKAVKEAYVWNKDKKALNQTYVVYHNLLYEIQSNNHKRPIPTGCWDKMQKMWINFKKAQWQGQNIFEMLCGLPAVKFQQEHYWTDLISGAKCRMKSDIEAVYETASGKHGWIADLKCTAGIKNFNSRGIKTRWQDRHYSSGYTQHCYTEDIEAPQNVIYIISDIQPPHLTYVREIQPLDAMQLQTVYGDRLTECWAWIKEGKKTIGFKEESMNQYFKPVN